MLTKGSDSSYPLAKTCLLRAILHQADDNPLAAQRAYDEGTALQRQLVGDERLQQLTREAAADLGVKFMD